MVQDLVTTSVELRSDMRRVVYSRSEGGDGGLAGEGWSVPGEKGTMDVKGVYLRASSTVGARYVLVWCGLV